MRLTAPCASQLKFVPSMQRCSPSRLNVVVSKHRKKIAWLLENEFSPRGEKEYSKVFNGVNYRDFTINIVDRGNEAWECSVIRRLVSAVAKHTVIIPKEPTKGSYFGQCTCGLVNVMLFRVSTWQRLW
jgi:hypothetical protein